MKKFLLFALSLLAISVINTAAEAQSTSPIPFRVSRSVAFDKSQYSWPVNIAMDSLKNKYVLGTQNFNGYNGLEIVLKVTKFDPTATQILYSNTLNISNFLNSDIAVATDGTAYVLHGNSITRISPNGQVVDLGWTSVNLSDGKSILVDSQNNIFVAGQLNNDGAVVKVRPDGSTAFLQTFGGSGIDIANAIAIDSNQTLVITGRTESPDFPTLNAFQTSLSGVSDALLVRLNSNNGATLSSTYLGGSGFDEGLSVAVGSSGNIVVVGETDSANYPVLNALQPNIGGQRDGFISKFNTLGSSLIYSTYIGGSSNDRAAGVALDSSDNATLTGITYSPNFPLYRSAKTVLEGNWQAFLTRLNTNGSSFIFSTYQSGGTALFYNGFDVIDDSFGGLFLTVNEHSYFGAGESHGLILKFSPYQTFLLYDPTKAFKPDPLIKIQLQDFNGVNQSSLNIPITALHVSTIDDSSNVLKTLSGTFTFDPNLKYAGSAPGGYKYSVDRTGLGAGNYNLVFTIGNENAWRTVPFSLK